MSYNLYPLSSPLGKAIPLDVYQPVAHKGLVVSSTPFTIPNVFTSVDLSAHMFILYPSVDMTISFDDTTPISDANAGDIFLPAGSIVPIYLTSSSISAISTDAGILHINTMKLWDSLATDVQQSIG